MNNEQKDQRDKIREEMFAAAAETEAPDSRPKRHWLAPNSWWELSFILGLIALGVGSFAYLEYTHEPPAATATASEPTADSKMPSVVANLPSLGYTARTVRGKVVRGRYWCGTSTEDAMAVGRAVRNDDVSALAELISLGDAFQIEEGTHVLGGAIDDGISLVTVESGFRAGRNCYIPTRALR